MKQVYLLLCCIVCFKAVHAQRPFITTWNTANAGVTANNQIAFIATGNNFHIGWVNTTNATDTGNVTGIGGLNTITFTGSGIYKVSITPGSGTFSAFQAYYPDTNNPLDDKKLLSVEQWGDIVWTDFYYAFTGCSNMVVNAVDAPDLTGNEDIRMRYAFKGCTSLTTIPGLNNWNVSNVTDMSALFADDTAFNSPIGNWNVSRVNAMSSMFSNAKAFNQPIGNWNVNSVFYMDGMFSDATSFNQNINNWNTGIVNTMIGIFSGATSFNQPLNNWNVSNVIIMGDMFSGATSFNQPLNNWNVSNVKIMDLMFFNATSFNQPVGNWNVGNVTTMIGMFQNAGAFNQSVGNWNVSAVNNMIQMFKNAKAFDQNLGAWNLNGSPDMSTTFDSSGMSCTNYSATLRGWAHSASTPNNLSLGASGLIYDSATAKAAHDSLTDIKGWTISGDEIGQCSILPVNFISFTATRQNSAALLNWSVGQEINVKEYEVEKSNNGLNFNTIGFVAKKGSAQKSAYSYVDNYLIAGTNYYRVKEVDNDGAYQYTTIQKINFTKFAWKVNGNPINNSSLQLRLDKTANVSIQIISSTGNVIKTIQKGHITSGNYNIPLNMNNLNAGLYFVRLIVDDKSYTVNVVKE